LLKISGNVRENSKHKPRKNGSNANLMMRIRWDELYGWSRFYHEVRSPKSK
jgi:hypothetical protein